MTLNLQVPKAFKELYTSKVRYKGLRGGRFCYPDFTEVMTKDGWIRIDDWKGQDILVFNKDKDTAYFEKPLDYIIDEKDEFITFKNVGLDFTTSKNHKHLLRSVKTKKFMNDKTTLEIANKIETNKRGFKTGTLVRTFTYDGSGIDISDDLLRLKVAVFADGHFPKTKNNSSHCRVNIKKDRKKYRLRELLRKCSIEYNEKKVSNGFSVFTFYMDNTDKHYPMEWYKMNYEQFKIIGEECLLWDGSNIGANRFSTTSKSDADFIQFVFTSLNKKTSIYIDNRQEKYTNGKCYTVEVNKTLGTTLAKDNNAKTTTKVIRDTHKNKDKMYCFTTSTGYFVVRQHDRIYVSGNSGKSFAIIDYILTRTISNPNLNVIFLRQVQKSIKNSSKKLLEDRIRAHGLSEYFTITNTEIRSKMGTGYFIFTGLQDHTADSIKSLEGFDIAFVEEAQNITPFSMELLLPTIRKEDSELLFSWNSRYETDAVEELFRTKSNSMMLHVNYIDNPFISQTMINEAEEMKELDIDKYNHIFLGGFVNDSALSIIKAKWIEASLQLYDMLDSSKYNGTKQIGYDVADGKDDRNEEIKNDANAFAYRKGIVLEYVEQWIAGQDELVQSTNKVREFGNLHNVDEVLYDNIGVGAGVGSILATGRSSFNYKAFTASAKVNNPNEEYKPKKLNIDMFKNLKAQATIDLADRFLETYKYVTSSNHNNIDHSKLIAINPNIEYLEQIKKELTILRSEEDGAGRLMIEKKSKLRSRGIKSPNLADAIIMSFFKLTNIVKTISKNRMNKVRFI